MTYCLAIKTHEGLIALADCRITAGNEVTQAGKLSFVDTISGHRFFIMTSGLRSVRDKVVAYVEQEIRNHQKMETMLDAIGVYTRCLRQVEREDRWRIEQSGMIFNHHAIVGGYLQKDEQPTLYLVYPEGNWIEVDHRTPFLSIGSTGYGKPILDRAMKYSTQMDTAIKLAYLSFDSTRLSSADVGFPIDMATFRNSDKKWRYTHLEYEDVQQLRDWWSQHIAELVKTSPSSDWMGDLL
jgi:putative proteasome-type protease